MNSLLKIEKRWFIKKWGMVLWTTLLLIAGAIYLGSGIQNVLIEGVLNSKDNADLFEYLIVILPSLLFFSNAILSAFNVFKMLRKGAKEAFEKAQEAIESGSLTPDEIKMFENKKKSITKKVLRNPAVQLQTTDTLQLSYVDFKNTYFNDWEVKICINYDMSKAYEAKEWQHLIDIIEKQWLDTKKDAVNYIRSTYKVKELPKEKDKKN